MELRQGTEGVWVLGFRPWGAQGEEQNGLFFGLKIGQRRDVRGNAATLQRGRRPTSRRSGLRRDVPENGTKQRRDVGCQRRDVAERFKNQRRDVDNSRRDVPEGVKINIATLKIHVATLQRHSKSTSRRWKSTSRRSREG